MPTPEQMRLSVTLSRRPNTQNPEVLEAFEALQSTFGGQTFNLGAAPQVISETLTMEHGQASRMVDQLIALKVFRQATAAVPKLTEINEATEDDAEVGTEPKTKAQKPPKELVNLGF